MYVVNDLDRFDELGDVMNRLPRLGARAAYFKQAIGHNLIEHKAYIALCGDDIPAIAGWTWRQATVLGELRSTEADNI